MTRNPICGLSVFLFNVARRHQEGAQTWVWCSGFQVFGVEGLGLRSFGRNQRRLAVNAFEDKPWPSIPWTKTRRGASHSVNIVSLIFHVVVLECSQI